MSLALSLLLVLQQDHPAPDPVRVAALLEQLGHDEIETRTRAQAALRRMGSGIKPLLRAFQRHPDPEVAGRCRELLVEPGPPPRHFESFVVYVDVRNNFATIAAGTAEGLQKGDRLELLFVDWDKDPTGRTRRRTATGVVTKFMGQNSMAKLEIDSGAVTDIKVEDRARLLPDPAPLELLENRDKAPALLPEGKVVMLEARRERLAVDLRIKDGVAKGDRFQVLRDGKIAGGLELVEVLTWGSWAAPVEGTLLEDLNKGDRILRVNGP